MIIDFNKYTSAEFLPLPTEVARDKDLTSFQKILYAEIASVAFNDDNGYCIRTNEYFQTTCNKSAETVRAGLAALVHRGFVAREYREIYDELAFDFIKTRVLVPYKLPHR